MKIDTRTNAIQATQPVAAARDNSGSFSAALAAATDSASRPDATAVQKTDFTNMTRQEMRDWANDRIRSGQMSLDDGRPFMAMTMKIPVDGSTVGELSAANDGERFDFTQKVRAGIEGALSRNDEMTRKMLESAMTVMKQYQR